MSVTRASIIKGFHDASRAHGEMRVASDYSLQIDGFEDRWLFSKTQFWPELTPGEGIEVPTPVGSAMWQPSQSKFHQQANVTFQETASGTISRMFEEMLACKGLAEGAPITSTGRFNAWVYYGTPEQWLERKRIEHAFLVVDEPAEADWENRTQLITIPATIYFHYYGVFETGSGNLCGGNA